MDTWRIEHLFTVEETIASGLLEGCEYPWEVLPKIGEYILALGQALVLEKYELVVDLIWAA